MTIMNAEDLDWAAIPRRPREGVTTAGAAVVHRPRKQVWADTNWQATATA